MFSHLRLVLIVAATILAFFASASPITPHVALEPRQYLDLPGMDFTQAQSECTVDQLNNLRQTFLELEDFVYATSPLNPAQGNDPAFVQFFGVGYLGVSQPCADLQ